MARSILWLLLILGLAAPAEGAGPGPAQAALLPVRVFASRPPAGAPPTIVVGPGDTLPRLGVRFRLSPLLLARANGLPGPNAPLKIGQILIIPLPARAGGQRTAGPDPAIALAAFPPPAQLNHLGTPRIVLADYMAWYYPQVFDGSLTFDLPASGPYYSSDLATIRRHLDEAQQACLDGFTVHWYGPFDPVTTGNFNRLLQASATTNMHHALVLLTNMWPGVTEQTLIDSIQYIIDHWANSPYFMRIGGRPLLLFTDMSRPWNSDGAALAAWTRIRAATDPDHKMIWMAEGLYTLYNPLFDGLYIYRIDHRDYPQSWLKQPRFANLLRAAEFQYQGSLPIGGLYFADTIAPGYDDTRAVTISPFGVEWLAREPALAQAIDRP